MQKVKEIQLRFQKKDTLRMPMTVYIPQLTVQNGKWICNACMSKQYNVKVIHQEEIYNFKTELGSVYLNSIISKLIDAKRNLHKVKWSSLRHLCLQIPSWNKIKMLYRYDLRTLFQAAVIGTAWKVSKYKIFSGSNTEKYGKSSIFAHFSHSKETWKKPNTILWHKSRYSRDILWDTSCHPNVEERFVTIMSPKCCSSSVP